MPLCRLVVHYIAEPFESRVGQQIKFMGRREISPSKGSVTVENITLVELAEYCSWYWHPPVRQNISLCGSVSVDMKPSGSSECIMNTLETDIPFEVSIFHTQCPLRVDSGEKMMVRELSDGHCTW